MKIRSIALSLCIAAATYSAHADTITTLTATPANANDSVLYMPQLGSDGTYLNSGVTALSNNGIMTTITFSSAGSVNLCDQYYDTCSDALPSPGGSLYASGTSVTYTFSSGVSAFGTTFEDQSNIGSNPAGGVTGSASLALYNGTTLLGTVTASGSFGGQFYFGGSDTSGADITSAVLSITAENINTSYATYYGNGGYDPSTACQALAGNSSNFDTSTTQGLINTLTCPKEAVRYLPLDQLALPSGFCTSNASACSAFEQQGGSISPSGPVGFTEGFQADSLDLVDGTPAASVAATPEPSSLVLLGTGMLAAAGAARRRFMSA